MTVHTHAKNALIIIIVLNVGTMHIFQLKICALYALNIVKAHVKLIIKEKLNV